MFGVKVKGEKSHLIDTWVSAGFAHNEFRPRSVSPITRMVSPRHKFDSPRLTVSDYPG